MDKYLIAIFILLATTVNAQVDLPETEIKTWKEPHFGPFFQPPDTVNIDLDQLTKHDTLVISGEYRECGEFGGHFEHIYISKQRCNLKCWLKIDQSCIPILPKIPSKVAGLEMNKDPYTDTISLHRKEKKLIMDYFKDYGILAVVCDYNSFVSTEFSISKNRKEMYFRKDLLGKWDGFTNLKEKLFSEK
ncbi:MAG TPA: hypothetical protein PKN48_03820 [Bacteroidales bacterium]|nr:hypothetical protein [Bacteroidales bacterium]